MFPTNKLNINKFSKLIACWDLYTTMYFNLRWKYKLLKLSLENCNVDILLIGWLSTNYMQKAGEHHIFLGFPSKIHAKCEYLGENSCMSCLPQNSQPKPTASQNISVCFLFHLLIFILKPNWP